MSSPGPIKIKIKKTELPRLGLEVQTVTQRPEEYSPLMSNVVVGGGDVHTTSVTSGSSHIPHPGPAPVTDFRTTVIFSSFCVFSLSLTTHRLYR